MNQEQIAEVAKTLSNFVNGATGADMQALAKMITDDHRTLQQLTMGLFLTCIGEWAKAGRNDFFDDRNGATVDVARSIVSQFGPPIPAQPLFDTDGSFMGLPYV